MHDLPIDQSKLKELVRQCKHLNIFPIYLPNYFYEHEHHPVASIIFELVQECRECLSTMKEEEINRLIDSLPPGIRMFIDHETTSNQGTSLDRIAIYYLVAELQRKYQPIRQSWDNDLSKSEVLNVYPELVDKFDEDGMLYIDSDLELLDGGIIYRDHVLHYHQFLRRGFTSNPNFDFTSRFIAYYHRTSTVNTFRIAIDHRRIMPKEFYQRIVELDTWYGPPFDPEKLDDPTVVGLTIIKRNKNSLFELTNKLDRTEFFWSYRDGIKTFQVEEISGIDHEFEGYYLNRYIHSERDIRSRIVRHLDGAVKVYLPDDYKARFNLKMPNEEKCHAKPKLFRIDGNIAVEDWITIISFFFKSNEMIIQYFNPDKFEQIFEERVRDFKAWQEKQAT